MTPDLQSTFPKCNDPAVTFQSRHKIMVKVFSYSLIVLFILAVASQVCAILVNANYSQTGAGIWCGILYLATSVMGLLAVRREDKPMTMALLCLAAGSVLTSLALVTLALLSLTSTYQGTYSSLCITSNAILTVVGFIGCTISIALITISAIAYSSHKRVQSQGAPPNELEEAKKISIDVSASQLSTDSSEEKAIVSQPIAAESTGSTGSDDIYESLKSQQGSVAESVALEASKIIDQIIEPIYAIPVKKKTISSSNLSAAGDFDIEVDNRRDSEVKENKVATSKWFHMEDPEEPIGSDVDDSQYSRNIELPKEDVIVHAPPN